MVCDEHVYESDIAELDEEIRRYANRRSAFARKDVYAVESTDEAMVALVTAEVTKINEAADVLKARVQAIEVEVTAHKREHMLSWAKRGLPEDGPGGQDDDDFRGVKLGRAMEEVLAIRKEAIQTALNAHTRKIPSIIERTPEPEEVVTDAELVAIAEQAMEAKKKR